MPSMACYRGVLRLKELILPSASAVIIVKITTFKLLHYFI